MTIETLKSIRATRSQIDVIHERIARLRSAAEGVTRQLSAAPAHGSERDRLAEYAAQLDDLERRLADRVIALEDLLLEADTWIACLPEQQRKVMTARYVDGLKWREVAERTHYSYRHCTKINVAAIKKMPPNAPIFCDRV